MCSCFLTSEWYKKLLTPTPAAAAGSLVNARHAETWPDFFGCISTSTNPWRWDWTTDWTTDIRIVIIAAVGISLFSFSQKLPVLIYMEILPVSDLLSQSEHAVKITSRVEVMFHTDTDVTVSYLHVTGHGSASQASLFSIHLIKSFKSRLSFIAVFKRITTEKETNLWGLKSAGTTSTSILIYYFSGVL